jgi:hypothetical protein
MIPNHDSKDYVTYKQRTMLRVAKQERLAQDVMGQRRIVAFRFYYRALASFGQWLIVYGYRLQQRYGELPEMPKRVQPVPSKRRA